MGNGQATLRENGATLSGSVTTGGVVWSLQGSIQGATVTLTMTAAGQADQSFQGTVSEDGATITGNAVTLSGHATCTHE